MNTNRLVKALFAAALVAVASFLSCSKNDYDYSDVENSAYSQKYDAIVTVKTGQDGKCFLQLDEDRTIEPVGWTNPCSSEVRALLNYTAVSSDEDGSVIKARIDLLEPVMTQNAVLMSSLPENFSYGSSPVIVYTDWLSNCEDGYITLHLAVQGEEDNAKRSFSLGVSSENPTELYLSYDNGDDKGTSWNECVVAFRIRNIVPGPVSDDAVRLNLHWMSYDGGKTVTFQYTGR